MLTWWLIFYIWLALGFSRQRSHCFVTAVDPLRRGNFIYTRDWQLLGRLKFVGGILLMLAVIARGECPALIQTHGEFFRVGISEDTSSSLFRSHLNKITAHFACMYRLLLSLQFDKSLSVSPRGRSNCPG